MLAECSGALVDGVGALNATGIRFSEVFEPPQIGCITEWPGAPSDLSGSRARVFLSLYTQKVQRSPQALMAQEQALLARLLPGTLKSMSPRQLYICTFPTYPKSLRVAALSWIIPDTCVSGMTRTET